MQPEPLWTVSDVAAYLGVTTRTIRTWQRCLQLTHLKIGGTVRFRPADVRQWAEQFVEESAPSL